MYFTNNNIGPTYDLGTANGLDLFNSALKYHTIPLHSFSISLFAYKINYHTRKRYVVKHNLKTEVNLMTVMETTTCFGLYWPSSGCLGNLRVSYMHARARGVDISTYA